MTVFRQAQEQQRLLHELRNAKNYIDHRIKTARKLCLMCLTEFGGAEGRRSRDLAWDWR